MANVSIDMKVSGAISIDGFSVEAYRRIMAFIEQVKAEENGTLETAPVSLAAPVVPAAEEPEVVPEESDDKWSRIGRYKGAEKIIEVFKDAEAHPDDYEWSYELSGGFGKKVPSLSDVSTLNIGHVLGKMATLGITKRTVRRNPENCIHENYFNVPIPKRPAEKEDDKPSAWVEEAPAEPKVKGADKVLGDRLREARMKRNMSIMDVANGVGVVATLIMNYETGIYTMSELMRKNICDFFREDIFADKKGEVA